MVRGTKLAMSLCSSGKALGMNITLGVDSGKVDK